MITYVYGGLVAALTYLALTQVKCKETIRILISILAGLLLFIAIQKRKETFYSGNLFMVAGGMGKVGYSGNGSSWTSGSGIPSSADLQCVSHNGQQWISGGTGGSSGAVLFSSTDGISWSPISSMMNYGGNNAVFNSLVWNNSMWILIANLPSKNYATEILFSTDGNTWTLQKSIGNFDNQTGIAGSSSIMAVSGMNVGTGASNTNPAGQPAIQYSTDKGISWNRAVSADAFFTRKGGLECIGFNGKQFLAGGCASADGSGPTLIYSSDGISWNLSNTSSVLTGDRVYAVSSNGSMWLAQTTYDIAYSSDAVNWYKASLPSGTQLTRKPAAWNGSTWVIGTNNYDGKQSGALLSTDGNTWNSVSVLSIFPSGIKCIAAAAPPLCPPPRACPPPPPPPVCPPPPPPPVCPAPPPPPVCPAPPACPAAPPCPPQLICPLQPTCDAPKECPPRPACPVCKEQPRLKAAPIRNACHAPIDDNEMIDPYACRALHGKLNGSNKCKF